MKNKGIWLGVLSAAILSLVALFWHLNQKPNETTYSAEGNQAQPAHEIQEASQSKLAASETTSTSKSSELLAKSRERDREDAAERSQEKGPDKKEKPIPYARILNLIRKEKVVNRIETETDEKGVRSTLTVYANGPTQMRTLLQEDWVDGPNGPELIGWNAMAADYILVKIAGSPSSSEFAGKINDFKAKVSATPIPGVYKVHFDGTDPITLHEIKDSLKAVADVGFSEPDYIMGIE
jgi:hypothetical protein